MARSESQRGCPREPELDRLVAGELSGEAGAELRRHVDGCAICRQRVEAVAKEPGAMGAGHASRGDDADVTIDGRAAKPSGEGRPPVSIEGYEIVRELHRGGQGVVYQAIQKSTKRKVAIKVLLEGPYASPSAKRRFEREIELVASLKHPNVISIFHSGGPAFVVGAPAREAMSRPSSQSGAMPLPVSSWMAPGVLVRSSRPMPRST